MIDAQQRQCIYVMLALRGRGHTLQEICDFLSARHASGARQGRWYCSTVKKILEQNAALAPLTNRLADPCAAAATSAIPPTALTPLRDPEPARRRSRRMHQAMRMQHWL